MSRKIAVAGAGIYGATIAIRLAEAGHSVRLFDPLGVLRATSAINQYRIHSGYHYPRSPETIAETLEARAEFTRAFAPAIVRNSRHYYAIPKEGSVTPPALFEKVMAQYTLACRPVRPEWMDFGYIDTCYEVDEQIYDPDALRDTVTSQIAKLGIPLAQRALRAEERPDHDFVVWATYGLGPSLGLFPNAKYQVAEKILIQLPPALQHISLVIVDGPFTAFDPYGSSGKSLFGSAKNTNHWTTNNPHDPIPEPFAHMLNGPEWEKIDFSRFEAMRRDSMLGVPASQDAVYMGSRFTIRVVENNPISDRRTLYVQETSPGEIHIFSGKVVGAVKAAGLVCERVAKS
jgi:FAD dependent oxidoreductase